MYVYIITNPAKTVLYTGVTNDIQRRLIEHKEQAGNRKTFAGRYYCYHLLYLESFETPEHAITREKEIKKWSRKKKETLISSENPNWAFLDWEISNW